MRWLIGVLLLVAGAATWLTPSTPPSIYRLRPGARRAEIIARLGQPDVTWLHRWRREGWVYNAQGGELPHFAADFYRGHPADNISGDRLEVGQTVLKRGCSLSQVEHALGPPNRVQRLTPDTLLVTWPAGLSLQLMRNQVTFFSLEDSSLWLNKAQPEG